MKVNESSDAPQKLNNVPKQMSQVRVKTIAPVKFAKLEPENVPPHGRRSIKAVLVGDKSSGKTKMLKNYQSNSFDSARDSSAEEITPVIREAKSVSERIVELELFEGPSDAGQRAAMLRDADVVLVCIPMDNKQNAAASLDRWLEEIRQSNSSNVPVCLVGTKSDLAKLQAIAALDGKALE